METVKIEIDMVQFIRKLTQKNYISLYINKGCNMILTPPELRSMYNLLNLLEFHEIHNEIKISDLLAQSGLGRVSFTSNIWKLMPYCINVKGLASLVPGRSGARFISINQNGLEVLKRWRDQNV